MNHALFGLLEQKARNNNLKQYSRILSNESKVKYNKISYLLILMVMKKLHKFAPKFLENFTAAVQ